MSYRDDRAARAQRIEDLTTQLAGIRSARASLATLESEERALVAQLDGLRKQTALTADDLRRRLPMIDRIEIATPCDVAWDSMQGDDRKRYCGQCQLHVYNVAAMSAADIESMLACGDTPCVRVFRRADGTVITNDCPVALRRKHRRRLAAVTVGAVASAAAIVGALALFYSERQLATRGPLDPKILAPSASPSVEAMGVTAPAVDPAPPPRHHMGRMVSPSYQRPHRVYTR